MHFDMPFEMLGGPESLFTVGAGTGERLIGGRQMCTRVRLKMTIPKIRFTTAYTSKWALMGKRSQPMEQAAS